MVDSNNAPSHDPMPPKIFSLAWVLSLALVMVVIGVGTFWGATQLTRVSAATKATCEERNTQIEAVNERFTRLIAIFDESLKNPRPDATPPSEEMARLFEEFRHPIPQVSCERLNK